MTMCERKYIKRDRDGMARKLKKQPFVEIPRKRIWLTVTLCWYANEIHLVLVEFLGKLPRVQHFTPQYSTLPPGITLYPLVNSQKCIVELHFLFWTAFTSQSK